MQPCGLHTLLLLLRDHRTDGPSLLLLFCQLCSQLFLASNVWLPQV